METKSHHAQNHTSLKKALLLYCVAALFLIFEMAVQVAPSVMAPDLMRDLHLGAYALGLMSGFYFYTYTAMQLPSGLLFDRFKPRIIITLSILICSAGCVLFALAQHYYLGCLARLLTGFGSAFAFVSVLVVASDLFKSKYFALLAGITQMLAAFGAMLGQMPISLLIGHLGWRHTLFLLAGIGFVLALIVWRLMNYEKLPEQTQCHFSATANSKHSLQRIFKNPQTWFIALYACLLWAPMSGFASLWGVSFLMKADGLSAAGAAFYCSLMWLGLALASPLLGIIASITNNKWLLLVLSSVVGALAFGLILTTPLHGFMLGLLLVLAGGACAGQALSFAVIQDINARSVKATAIAFNNMAVVVSGAIAQPLIGHLLANGSLNDLSHYALSDYKRGLSVILIAYAAAAFIALFFIQRTSGPHPAN